MSQYVPIVIESSGARERAFDIYSRLLKDRIIFITGEINDYVASVVCAQLLFLQSEGPKKAVSVYINSPGGSVTSALSIYDTMQFVTCPISTVCMGLAASAGSLLLIAGEHGMRYSLPNSRVMLHQPSGGARGQASDIEIQAKEILFLRDKLNKIYHKHIKCDMRKIKSMMDRDFYLSPEEALDLGIIDCILDDNYKKQDSN